MYTSVLQNEAVSVAVHMHVRVRSAQELQTKLWIVEVIDSDDHAVNIRMVPASVHSSATCKELRLRRYEEGYFVEFIQVELARTSTLLFARRHKRAVLEAGRRAAC